MEDIIIFAIVIIALLVVIFLIGVLVYVNNFYKEDEQTKKLDSIKQELQIINQELDKKPEDDDLDILSIFNLDINGNIPTDTLNSSPITQSNNYISSPVTQSDNYITSPVNQHLINTNKTGPFLDPNKNYNPYTSKLKMEWFTSGDVYNAILKGLYTYVLYNNDPYNIYVYDSNKNFVITYDRTILNSC